MTQTKLIQYLEPNGQFQEEPLTLVEIPFKIVAGSGSRVTDLTKESLYRRPSGEYLLLAAPSFKEILDARKYGTDPPLSRVQPLTREWLTRRRFDQALVESILAEAVRNPATSNAAQRPDDDREPANTAQPTSKREQRAEWLAKAMLLVHDHPEWSDAHIAYQVNKNPGTLSRSREYQAAAAMARGDKADRHKGHITVDPQSGQRDVEAYSDDPAERDWDT